MSAPYYKSALQLLSSTSSSLYTTSMTSLYSHRVCISFRDDGLHVAPQLLSTAHLRHTPHTHLPASPLSLAPQLPAYIASDSTSVPTAECPQMAVRNSPQLSSHPRHAPRPAPEDLFQKVRIHAYSYLHSLSTQNADACKRSE